MFIHNLLIYFYWSSYCELKKRRVHLIFVDIHASTRGHTHTYTLHELPTHPQVTQTITALCLSYLSSQIDFFKRFISYSKTL